MQDAVEERFGRRPAPLRIVPGALEVVDGWADVQVPSVVRLERLAGSGREIWEFAQEAVHLRHDARRLDAADLSEELGVDGVRGDESLERRLHIHVREDGPGHHSLPVLELDAGRPAVVREDTADRGRRLDPGPWSAAAFASAAEMPPMPPFEHPKVCLTPLISWSSMWPSMRAVPGVFGPAGRPIVVAVASIAFSSSDSKNPSRWATALCRRRGFASSSASAPLNIPSKSGSGGGDSRTIASMSSITSVQKATYFG